MRPLSLPHPPLSSFLPCPQPQVYDADAGMAKIGSPIKVTPTGDGTQGSPFVATLPFSAPQNLAFAVQASGGAGAKTTAFSPLSDTVVVGELRTPARLRRAGGARPAQGRGGAGRCNLLLLQLDAPG